ncbi:hypothetical protein FBZ85_12335 [Azospirillum brasilense]|nr:hypothetical protein FBZ85_12335 [Azospirillum brasilense]
MKNDDRVLATAIAIAFFAAPMIATGVDLMRHIEHV